MNIDCVLCAQCRRELAEVSGTAVAQREPCPSCGSKSRLIKANRAAEITPRGMLRFKVRRQEGGRPLVEGRVGSDLQRLTGRWMRLERIIDRARDWYREHISDRRTGEVVRDVEERLSEHTRHGSAKRNDVAGGS